MDVCQSLIDTLNKRTTDLENLVYPIKRKQRELESLIDTLFKTTNPSVLAQELNTLNAGTFGLGSDIASELEKFTGSCLNSLKNGLLGNSNDIVKYLGDKLSLNAYELQLFKAFQKFRAFMGGLGVPSLVNLLDTLIGCLSSSGLSECTDPLSDISQRIDTALDAMYMDTGGSWIESDFLSGMNGMTAPLKANMEAFTAKMDIIAAEAQANIATGIDSLKTNTDKLEVQYELM